MKHDKVFYGIWIDHTEAHILKANSSEIVETMHIDSGVEAHHKGGLQEGEHHSITNQSTHNNRRDQQMHAFCKEVLKAIADADEIMICGPSNAKHDLKRAIEETPSLKDKLKAIETCDKMSENQLKAHVEELLELPRA